jgi:hypothetical protein
LKSDGLRATAPPRGVGTLEGLYSNLTDYEVSAKNVIPMPVHLALDGVLGAFLASSPWALGTAKKGKRFWLPHVAVGSMEVFLALTTKTHRPRQDRLSRGRRLLRRAVVAGMVLRPVLRRV